MLNFFKKQKINKNRGFTLVELLVTIVIFVIITGVVLVNSNTFDNTVLLNNLTYDVALTIKQAQSYGVNVRENNSDSLFDLAYGVYFDTTQSNTNFVLFNNNSSSTNSVTSCAVSSDCVQKYSMKNGTQVANLCAGNNEDACDDTSQLSIVFVRPKLTAYIYSDGNTNTQKSYAKITLSGSNGATSSVVINSSGQIYIKK